MFSDDAFKSLHALIFGLYFYFLNQGVDVSSREEPNQELTIIVESLFDQPDKEEQSLQVSWIIKQVQDLAGQIKSIDMAANLSRARWMELYELKGVLSLNILSYTLS